MSTTNNVSKAKAETIEGNFLAFLSSKREGVTIAELDAELAALVAEVYATGRDGKMTYTVEVSKKNRSGVVIIDDLQITKPKRQKETSYFYCAANGRLLRNDPNRGALDFRVVEGDLP
jgi:hypothetical protein